jgi:succinate dehydrogenase/fumarate reductase flavoprotein subunit
MLWATGEEIIDVLLHRLREQEVEALNDIMITDVLTSKGKVVGALGINVFSGDIVGFATKAVVLATGGWGQVYSFTSATEDLTGDGQAIAYRAGADLVDMEMVTFCPSVQIWPPGPARGSMFVYRLAWLGSYLLNKYGERFMCNYPEEIADISLRTEWHKLIWSVAQAIEVDEARGSPHGGIYKSVKHLPWNVVNESLDWRAKGWKFKGADMSDIAEILKSGNAIEVGPAAHYFEGGVKIDETCQTTVPGLFAAGECAGGLFGSNRVAAATTEVIVEGAVAGKSASKYATECPNNAEVDVEQVKRTKERLLEPHRRESGIDPIELRKRVRRIADESIHVIRDSERLGKAVRELEEIRRKDLPRIQVLEKSRRYNMQWVLAIELGNMIQLLELSARSALMRTESRGVHYRLDFPVMNNDDWLKEVVTRSVDGEPCLNCRKVTVTKMIPPSGRMPYFDAILDAVRKIKVYRKSRLV